MPNKHFFKKVYILKLKKSCKFSIIFSIYELHQVLLLPKNVFFTIKSNKLQVLNKMLYICMN